MCLCTVYTISNGPGGSTQGHSMQIWMRFGQHIALVWNCLCRTPPHLIEHQEDSIGSWHVDLQRKCKVSCCFGIEIILKTGEPRQFFFLQIQPMQKHWNYSTHNTFTNKDFHPYRWLGCRSLKLQIATIHKSSAGFISRVDGCLCGWCCQVAISPVLTTMMGTCHMPSTMMGFHHIQSHLHIYNNT